MNKTETLPPRSKLTPEESFVVEFLNDLRGLELHNEKIGEHIEIASLAISRFVNKPWGFELWLAQGEETDTPYALKIIFIKAGTRTSLHSHVLKEEHSFHLAGDIDFYFENPEDGQLESRMLVPGHVISIKPPAKHRFYARTDVLFVEVSTKHVGDVVRHSDDQNRSSGKIDSEHA